MIQLNHQTQPTAVTCVQACLAMALDVPVADVIKVFGQDPMCGRSLLVALSKCRILHNQLLFGTLICTGWYFAVVPSLNHRGVNHQILIHWDSEAGIMRVLDPSNRERYAESGSNLKSWSELILFQPGGRLPEVEGLR